MTLYVSNIVPSIVGTAADDSWIYLRWKTAVLSLKRLSPSDFHSYGLFSEQLLYHLRLYRVKNGVRQMGKIFCFEKLGILS